MTYKNTTSIVKDGLEVAIDQFVNSGIAKDIPVVNTIANMMSISSSINDSLFAKKLIRFINAIEEVSEKDYKKIKDFASTSCADEVSSKILHVINAQTDEKKSEIVADLFLAFVDKRITSNELSRYLDIVNSIFIDDLERYLSELFLGEHEFSELERMGLSTLINTSLFTAAKPGSGRDFARKSEYTNDKVVRYAQSNHGRNFKSAYEHGLRMRSQG